MNGKLIFHHIGIATKNMEKCISTYEKLGYKPSSSRVEPTQNVKICFLSKARSPLLEIIEPLNNESPISRIIKNLGTTPYHTCYEVSDIQKYIKKLEDLNFRLLFEPIVSEAMDNGLFCYLFSPHIGLIEIYQKKELLK